MTWSSSNEKIESLKRKHKNKLAQLRRWAKKHGLRILSLHDRNRRRPGWFLAKVEPDGPLGYSLEQLEAALSDAGARKRKGRLSQTRKSPVGRLEKDRAR